MTFASMTDARARAAVPGAVNSAILLWLAGCCLRLTVLAVPPVIPLLHADLGLSETSVGILSSLPSLMFAFAAVLGSLLVARLGSMRTLTGGLLVMACASALRAAAPDALLLDAATVVMCLGISVMHPSLPQIVRYWMPSRVGFGTSVYANGWLVGEVFAVWLTIPYVLPLVGGSWRLAFVAWSVPVAIVALLFAPFARRAAHGPSMTAARRWWPRWRDPLVWRLGVIMGGANIAYFTTNAFIPDYLSYRGAPELIGPALTALNLGQLPVSFLMLALAGRLTGRPWAFMIPGIATLVGVAGMVGLSGVGIVAAAALIGFSCAGVMVLSLAVPPLVCEPEDLPRTMAGIFTISYTFSVVVPILGGWAWDASNSPAAVFALIALGAAGVLVLPWTFGFAPPAPAMDK